MIRYTDINTGNELLDEALENYLMHGLEPGGFLTSVLANDLRLAIAGGFLTSVLANDLRLAIGRADHRNIDNLPRIVQEVTFKMPSIAWGSYAAVKDWCKDVDGRRSEYAAQKEKEFIWRSLKGEVKVKAYDDPPF